jgi:acetolactate synthase I/II/III large subunit
MTCGELLTRLLDRLGVRMVFGIPGVHTVELYRGLPDTRIRHITPRHEQGAGFMADGYARVTGRPGVCFVITGPGMTNIMTALGQAYADSIPMLVISSVNRTEQLGMGEGRLHELPSQRSLASGVTAFSHTLMRPDELPAVLARAFAVFASKRPRPVHIEIPIDVITANADHVEHDLGAVPSRPAPDPEAIVRAAALLAGAERPMVLFGGGAADAGPGAVRLVEALEAPTACTFNAKGLLPRHHPLSVGSNAGLPPVRELLRDADVVLAIGTELGETDYDVYFDGNLRIPGSIIRIDIDPEQLNRNFLAHVAIVSDARLAVDALTTALLAHSAAKIRNADPRHRAPPPQNGETQPSSPGAKRAAETRARLEAGWPAAWQAHRRALEVLQEALPEAIVVGDSTQVVYSGNHLYEANAPRSWFNAATGYGTLGFGLPAAIGAKLAAPGRSVVALVGDGGLQFTLAELASAVEAETPVIVLLWNNRGYGEIKRYMQMRGLPLIGVDIHTPDFLTLAAGFGCDAVRASGYDHLRHLLEEAGRATRSTVIEILEEGEFSTRV